MKKTIATFTGIFLIIILSSAPARADRKTMEGFLLGTGAVLLGTAIYHGMNQDSDPGPAYASHSPRYREGRHHRPAKRYARHHRPRGHWEVERVWVEPEYERKWNPGHYNRRGQWVSGRYERFKVSRGYYREIKTWVRH